MELLDGKRIAKEIKDELTISVAKLKSKGGKTPYLAAIIVGNDQASITYVAAKEKACRAVGIESRILRMPQETSQESLLNQIDIFNSDTQIDGFIVQLPLPDHIDQEVVLHRLDPSKDIDGFHPTNFGKMALGLPSFIPATPNGILELLKRYAIKTDGKHCVVLGRSHIVGLPMSILMAQKAYPGNATVTLAHSHTKDLVKIIRTADILIVALGMAGFVTGDMVKDGVVVVDVGITRIEDASKKSGSRLVGDVDFESVAPKSSYITPVPGGVGPMTIASLLQNTVRAMDMH